MSFLFTFGIYTLFYFGLCFQDSLVFIIFWSGHFSAGIDTTFGSFLIIFSEAEGALFPYSSKWTARRLRTSLQMLLRTG